MGEDSSDNGAGVLAVHRDGEILRLTMDRPSARNALTPAMVETFIDALTNAATDDTLRAIHITGAGGNFCGGSDWLSTNKRTTRPRTGDLIRRVPHQAHRIVELIHTAHLPVVATVRGWAVGLGCNLALAADFTIAEQGATFWEPFVDRGFTPDSGASWLIPRLAGVARAKEMVLLGEKVAAGDAADWGLIHRCAPPDEVDAVAEGVLNRLATGPTVALGLAKRAINRSQRASLGEAMDGELYDLELACRAKDFKEGLTAFQQRRPPEFTGQ